MVVMSDYRRYFVPGGTYFFTVVTERRAPIFGSAPARKLLGEVMRACLARYPASVHALVLLPNHLHALLSLPPGDSDYSLRWRWIKREFTRSWLALGGQEQPRSLSRRLEQRTRRLAAAVLGAHHSG
jgi:putative transposase